MDTIDMTELRRMACEMSGVNRWGVAIILRNGLPWCEQQYSERLAVDAIAGATRFAVALNGVVIAQSGTPAILTPDAPQTPELAPLAALSDADLKARYDAAWALVLAYGEEIRRRAGEAVQSELIPF